MPIDDSNSTSILNRQWLVRTAITLAVLVALYLLVRRLSGVLLPFLISFVVAYMLAPIVNFFQHTCRLKSRVLSIIVTILLVIGVLTGAVAAVMPAISRQANALSQSVKTYVSQWDGSEYFSPQVNQRIEEIIQSIDIKTLIESQGIKKVLPILGDWISSGVNALMGLAVAFICILYIIFLLIDYEKITTNWHKYIPTRFRDSIVMLTSDLDRNMNAYFRGQALVAGIVGILFAIGFQIIGLPMGIGIGLFIGLLNLVPYMQALGIPPCILLGLIQSAETGRPVWVVMLCIAAVFIIVQTIQDMVLVPKIMGDVTGMGPAWILLSLSVWGSLLGFVGMIIALPVTTLLVSYYKRFVLHMTDDMTKPLPRTSWNIPFLKRKTKK